MKLQTRIVDMIRKFRHLVVKDSKVDFKLRRRIVDMISKFRHSVVKVSKVDSHSEVIKVSKVVKVVHFSEFVKDLHTKVVAASKVVNRLAQ